MSSCTSCHPEPFWAPSAVLGSTWLLSWTIGPPLDLGIDLSWPAAWMPMLNPRLICEDSPRVSWSPLEQSRDQGAGQGARRGSPSLFTALFYLSWNSCSQLWESHLYWEVGGRLSPVWMCFQGLHTSGHESQVATLWARSPRQQTSHRMLSLTPAPGVLALSVHLCVRSRARSWPSPDISPYPAREPDPWPATLAAGEASWASRPQ